MNRIKVLIVTASPAWQQRFQASVGACGQMQLLGVASTFAQAQALLDQEPADVVVLDFYPSGSPGLGFLRHAARYHSRSQVLVVTDCGEDEQVWAAIEAGASGYLLRHTVADNICASIHDVH